jgi:hypothetical protein
MSSLVVAWWRISNMFSASLFAFLPPGDCLTTNLFYRSAKLLLVLANTVILGSETESELLYGWRFTAKQFFLRLTTRDFLHLNPCGHSPYVMSTLTRGWVCLFWIGFAFVKSTYRIYSIDLRGYGKCLCFPRKVSPIKVIIWNKEPLMGIGTCLWELSHIYV